MSNWVSVQTESGLHADRSCRMTDSGVFNKWIQCLPALWCQYGGLALSLQRLFNMIRSCVFTSDQRRVSQGHVWRVGWECSEIPQYEDAKKELHWWRQWSIRMKRLPKLFGLAFHVRPIKSLWKMLVGGEALPLTKRCLVTELQMNSFDCVGTQDVGDMSFYLFIHLWIYLSFNVLFCFIDF